MEHVSNEAVLIKMGIKRTLRIRKRVKISGMHSDKRGLEEFNIHRIYLKHKGREKHRVTCLTNFCKWMTEQGLREILRRQPLLRATKDKKLRRKDMTLGRKSQEIITDRTYSIFIIINY